MQLESIVMILKLLLETQKKKKNDMYENIEECSSSKEHKLLIVFDYMITDMLIKKT